MYINAHQQAKGSTGHMLEISETPLTKEQHFMSQFILLCVQLFCL
jgi:hypothetical protein